MRALTSQEIVEAARRALYYTVRDAQDGGEVGFGALYRSLRASQTMPEVAYGNLYRHLGLRQAVVEVAYRLESGAIFTRDVAFDIGSGIGVCGVSVETGNGIIVSGGGYA